MILALLIMALISIGSLVATLLMGLNIIGGNHILWALFAVPFGLFTLTTHMFYFIGTGSDIKKFLAKENVEASLTEEIREETKVMKRRTFPILLWAMVFQMATFILGGAVGGGMIPPVLHLILANLAILFTIASLVQAHIMARRTFYLLLRVGTLVGADQVPPATGPSAVKSS